MIYEKLKLPTMKDIGEVFVRSDQTESAEGSVEKRKKPVDNGRLRKVRKFGNGMKLGHREKGVKNLRG